MDRSTRLLALAATLALALVCALTLAVAAQAAWPRVQGKASVFGNDPFIGFVDYQDNCRTASGTSCTSGGVAVSVPGLGWRESFRRYGRGWWWICAPRQVVPRGARRCHLVKQSEAGPHGSTGRVLDVSAVTARRAWRIRAGAFPTDEGTWTLRYRGRR